jgi:F-type H+-transporting ATPase subunit b
MTRARAQRPALRTRLAPALAAGALALAAAPARAAEGGGIEIFPDPPILIPLLVLFAALVWPLSTVLWRPLLRVIDERRERIEGTRARAQRVAAEAEDVLGHYQRAVEQARRAAEADRRELLDGTRQDQAQITGDARRSADAEVAAARARVARSVEEARAELQRAAQELAREAAARVLGRPLA